jgi:hypothetical protein
VIAQIDSCGSRKAGLGTRRDELIAQIAEEEATLKAAEHQQDEARRRIEAVKHQLATMLATPIVAARFRFSKATGFQPRQ